MSRRRIRGLAPTLAAVAAVATVVVTAPAASAATAPPDYTVVYSNQLGVFRVDNATGTLSQPSLANQNVRASAITPDGKTAYVLRPGATLTPVTVATGVAGTPIDIGNLNLFSPGLAISPDGSLAYVATPDRVTPVPLPGGPAGAAIPTPSGINFSVAFSADGATAYVLGLNGAGTKGLVTPIDVASGQAMAAIPLPGYVPAGPIRISPDGKTAYMPGSNQSVYTIDLTTRTAGPSIPVGLNAQTVAISPDGKTLFTVGASAAHFPQTAVVAVNLATGALGPEILLPGDEFEAIDMVITPDGRTLYLANHHVDQFVNAFSEILTVDVRTGTVGPPIVISTADTMLDGFLSVTPDQAPVAKLTAKADCAKVSFDASGSTVRYGSIVRYAWSFGDGKTAVTTGPKVTHTYADAGTHLVTVTETDSAGTSTQQVFTGQTMTLNGGPSAVAKVTVRSTDCSASNAPAAVTPPPANVPTTSSGTDELPRTGAQTSSELGLAGLMLLGGTGLVTVARRRRRS